MVFDPAGHVLLIRYVVPREEGEFCFWITAGGEIEEGETEIAAARREIFEELGLTLEVEGPLYEEENEFMHQGEMRSNRDYFFRACCSPEAPVLTGFTADEIAVMREMRWWSIEEITGSKDNIFPKDLAARILQFGVVEGASLDPAQSS